MLPEYPVGSLPFGGSYEACNDPAYGTVLLPNCLISNNGGVQRVGIYSPTYWKLYSDSDSMSAYGYIKQNDFITAIGSNKNRSISGEKDFITIKSYGGLGDTIDFSDPITLGSKSAANNILAGSIYHASTAFGGGVGPAYQRTTGQNATSDMITTTMRGSGVPTSNASYIGQLYTDTSVTPRNVYVSVTVNQGENDWKLITTLPTITEISGSLQSQVSSITADGSLIYTYSTSGSDLRTLKDRFSDTINVKDFGAKGDGVTDDTASIQAAIDYAFTLGGDVGYSGFWIRGSKVFIPKGEYKISSTLVVKKGVCVQGDGRSSTRIFPDAVFSGTAIINLGDTTVLGNPQFGTRICGLNISCKNIVEKGVYSINVQEGGGVFDCLITQFTSIGIHWEWYNASTYPSLADIDRCEIWAGTGATECILFNASYNCRIQNTTTLADGAVSSTFHGIRGVNCNLKAFCIHYEGADSGIFFDDSSYGEAQNIEGGNSTTRPSGLGSAAVRIGSTTGAVMVTNAHNYDSIAGNVGETLRDDQNNRLIDGPVTYYSKGRYSLPGESGATFAGALDIVGPEQVDLLKINNKGFLQYINGLSGCLTHTRQARLTNSDGTDIWSYGMYSPASGDDDSSLVYSAYNGTWSDVLSLTQGAPSATIASNKVAIGGGYVRIGSAMTLGTDTFGMGYDTSYVNFQSYGNRTLRFNSLGNQIMIVGTDAADPSSGQTTIGGGDIKTYRDIYAGGVKVAIQTPSSAGIVVRGAASQETNLQEWRDSSNNLMTSVDQEGKLRILSTSVQAYFRGSNQGNIEISRNGYNGYQVYSGEHGHLGFWDLNSSSETLRLDGQKTIVKGNGMTVSTTASIASAISNELKISGQGINLGSSPDISSVNVTDGGVVYNSRGVLRWRNATSDVAISSTISTEAPPTSAGSNGDIWFMVS